MEKLESIEKDLKEGCNDLIWTVGAGLTFKIHAFEKASNRGEDKMYKNLHLGLWLNNNLQKEQTFNLYLKVETQSLQQRSQRVI